MAKLKDCHDTMVKRAIEMEGTVSVSHDSVVLVMQGKD